MYVKRRKNPSGSTSIQILRKVGGKTKLVRTIGCAKEESKLKELEENAQRYLEESSSQLELDFKATEIESVLEEYLNSGNKPTVRAIGPELILGKIFDEIGLNIIREELFRHLVLARLTYPVSKLKTTEYLFVHHQKDVDISSIYRFLDRFHRKYKSRVEDIAFKHTKKTLCNKIAIVFYDMTSLYFEAEDEDDLRKIGFSKDGKFQHPQIMLGVLVGENGYPIAYDIYEGNIFEGHTLLPAIERAQSRFGLAKPIIVADSGLLSKHNLSKLSEQDYTFIIGARIKNESEQIRKQILLEAKSLKDGESLVIDRSDDLRLIINFSEERAAKDYRNREKGLARLEKRVKSGWLTKATITNRGYSKFLRIDSNIKISIDKDKIADDQRWDGLKGYLTNSSLKASDVVNTYNQLWRIENAFRISKTDLRIRPIFHRKKDRIEAHICIAFVAYSLLKELERKLLNHRIRLSPQRAIELTKTIFEINWKLPSSNRCFSIQNKLTPEQQLIVEKLA